MNAVKFIIPTKILVTSGMNAFPYLEALSAEQTPNFDAGVIGSGDEQILWMNLLILSIVLDFIIFFVLFFFFVWDVRDVN